MELIKEIESKIKNNKKVKYGIFKCECGKEEEKSMSNGKRQIHCMECGNKVIATKNKIAMTKHGGKYTLLYGIWMGMKTRCYKEYKKTDKKNYKDRGIIVYEKWRSDFSVFRSWALSNGYKKNLSIDRINNDGNYEPTNCRWTTQQEQMRNTRYNVLTKEKADEIRKYFKTHTNKQTIEYFENKINSKNISSLINNVVRGGQWK